MIKDEYIREWYYKNRKYPRKEIMKILDVEYVHLSLDNKDDLYITKHGLPFIDILKPENYWSDEVWFEKNGVRLSTGTSSIYKVRTKKVNGAYIDLVIKWNRMGQDIPGGHEVDDLIFAEFNSPFEEFSLVMELNEAVPEKNEEILIQKPLAIFVPNETSELWRLGRREYKIKAKIDSHKDVELDMHRSYAVIYEWIEGVDLMQAYEEKKILKKQAVEMDDQVRKSIEQKGYVVRDHKPEHVILRTHKNGKLLAKKNGNNNYGLIDFELLSRTSDLDEEVKKSKRANYLKRQKDRFSVDSTGVFSPHLKPVNIMGVDYIYGHVESTRGRLWVVGKDPYLFDYFLPERWEQTPKTRLSVSNMLYYTVTKDNIHLVWKVSRVGYIPDKDPFDPRERTLVEYGYNSPFEEVSLAIELGKKGIPTIYPRAIYMSGNNTKIPKHLFDDRRFENHKTMKTPDRKQILSREHDYMVIWGYWNGPDDKLASVDGDYYEGIDALRAYRTKIICDKEYMFLLKKAKRKLALAGVMDQNLKGRHFLISIDSEGKVVRNDGGEAEIRICNFDFLKRIKGKK